MEQDAMLTDIQDISEFVSIKGWFYIVHRLNW